MRALGAAVSVPPAIILFALLGVLALPVRGQTTVAGYTPGSFRVTETGAAEYRIPIQVPPGIAGMEPKLALVYNSQAGNGLLGVGWSLDGLSAITRCPRTVTQDGVRGGVNYDWNDRYCLDGQRLLAISGSYGADGTEYRTERESFTKVISYGTAGNGPAWFKAWTKSGQILEYANTADSRIEAQGKTSVRVWALNKVSDTKGNYQAVSYYEDPVTNGDYRPVEIAYTGTSSNASVKLIYEIRPDPIPLFRGGSSNRTITRIVALQAYVGSSLVNEYRLSYQQGSASQRSRVTSITQCNGDGTACFAPTVATPSDAGVTWSVTNLPATQYADPNNVIVIGDFNGDGRADIATFNSTWASIPVCFATGSGWDCRNDFATSAYPGGGGGNGNSGIFPGASPLVGDFNGDGLADIALFNTNWASIPVCFSTGTGWVCRNDFATSTTTGGGGGNANSGMFPGSTPLAGDFDGDGRTDIAMFNANWASIPVCFSTGSAWQCRNDFGTSTTTGGGGGNANSGIFPGTAPLAGDFDGDGRTDIAMFNSNWASIPACFSTGTGWQCRNEFAGPTGGNGNANSYMFPGMTPLVGDFNGDGMVDIAMFNSNWGSIPLCLSTGTSWNCNHEFAGPPGGNGNANSYIFTGMTPLVGDFNGDGRADIAMYNPNWASIPFCFAVGGSATMGMTWQCHHELLGGPYPGTFHVGDFSGDGKSDIAIRGDGWSSIVTAAAPGPFPDVLASVASGGGVSITLTAKPTTDASVYAKDTGSAAAAYPTLDVPGSFYAIASATLTDARGSRTTNYLFGGLKADSGGGRGLLGFRWLETVDAPTGVKLRTEFRQDWPYSGMPSLVKKTESSGVVLSQVSNTFSCTNPTTGSACTVATGNRYFSYVSQSVETSNDLGGTALPTVTTGASYDSYGNATSVVVGTSDGYSKVTSNVFTNDVPNWLLGRLTRSTVSSTTP